MNQDCAVKEKGENNVCACAHTHTRALSLSNELNTCQTGQWREGGGNQKSFCPRFVLTEMLFEISQQCMTKIAISFVLSQILSIPSICRNRTLLITFSALSSLSFKLGAKIQVPSAGIHCCMWRA